MDSDVAYIGDGTTAFPLRFNKNNGVTLQQKNAAGSAYLNLPYFDNSDLLIIAGRQKNTPGGIPSGGNTGVFYAWNPGEIPNGSQCFNISASTQTNSEFYAFYAEGSTNWRIKYGLRNTHASGYAQVDAIAAGPAFFRATDFTNDWSWGKDASGHFFLCKGDPGTNPVLSADKTNFNVAFSKPPKLPSYTVAGVPSAATYGAGSMIYVTDESGGAVPAFSDGTSWRRMTDRAVVS
jgi:hypothetical protein